jgi:hypothetical protein
MPEAEYKFTGGDVVQGAPVVSFPGPLYLIIRAIFILRGICTTVGGLHDVSVADIWARHALAGLWVAPEVAEERAAVNAALDTGRGLV